MVEVTSVGQRPEKGITHVRDPSVKKIKDQVHHVEVTNLGHRPEVLGDHQAKDERQITVIQDPYLGQRPERSTVTITVEVTGQGQLVEERPNIPVRGHQTVDQ